MDEILGAEQDNEQLNGLSPRVCQEMRSVCHDVLSAHHERDYQASGLFLLPSIWKYPSVEVAVIEVRDGDTGHFRTYSEFPASNTSHIFLVAHKGHMMWGKPTAGTPETLWGDWETEAFSSGAATDRPALPWKQRMQGPEWNKEVI